MFALPVLRQGDLPLLLSVGLPLSAFLRKRRAGARAFCSFFAKSVTAGELEQEGTDIRAWMGVRDEFFLSDFVFSESLHSQHGAKALPLLAVRE